MSFCVKLSLAKKLSQALKINVGPSTVDRIVKNLRLSSQHNGENIHYSLPCKIIDGSENINIRGGTQFHIDDDNVILPVDKTEFITQVLTSTGDKHVYKTQLNCTDKVVVEFSSPNIAKPFHVGHFRGTVLGNFVANLSNYFANNVVCLNYLGDWGTQFGLLQIGLKELNIKHTDLEQSPLDVLYKAYVKANELAKINPDVQEQA
ncbi:probable arginine--tRNA ligase, mitochondrial [Diaphorina citri]|uniref:Probable arginine--tRNA ligase, mitochondrial n=1 Tax=Diaphorina citri TaxID=121845 RepID=A0A3Q0IWP6_DIACI|nr:probable arginine--tRNA ligase, mitochondrial [Diaphorina citri]